MNDMIDIIQNLFVLKIRLYYSFLFGGKKAIFYFLYSKEI